MIDAHLSSDLYNLRFVCLFLDFILNKFRNKAYYYQNQKK